MNPQHIILFHHFRRVLQAAKKEGISVAPLKGAHLVTSVYPLDEDRGLFADVDFLVKEDDYEKSWALLLELGFTQRINKNRLESAKYSEDTGFYLEIAFEKRILFEVHRYLERKDRHPVNYEDLWLRAYESTFDGVSCMRLSSEDHFLHCAMHLMTDRFTSPKRGLRDLELLLMNGNVNLDIVADRAVSWQCSRAVWLALTLLAQKSPGVKVDKYIKKLSPPVYIKRALRFLVPDVAGFRFANIGLRNEQAILWPFLMDGLGPILRFSSCFLKLRIADILRQIKEKGARHL